MLEQLDLRYFVDGEGKAILLTFEGDKADYTVYILVDQELAVVYVGLADYLKVPPEHPCVCRVMCRLMEINWDLPLGKFEWRSSEGEVRLSFVFTTENGLGVDALGAALSNLLQTADKYYIELHALLEE